LSLAAATAAGTVASAAPAAATAVRLVSTSGTSDRRSRWRGCAGAH